MIKFEKSTTWSYSESLSLSGKESQLSSAYLRESMLFVSAHLLQLLKPYKQWLNTGQGNLVDLWLTAANMATLEQGSLSRLCISHMLQNGLRHWTGFSVNSALATCHKLAVIPHSLFMLLYIEIFNSKHFWRKFSCKIFLEPSAWLKRNK